MSYLIHYNKNHSSKNGQFTSGDGDGDGIANDHAHRSKGTRNRRVDPTVNNHAFNRGRKNLHTGIGLGIGGVAAASVSNFLKRAANNVDDSDENGQKAKMILAGSSYVAGLAGAVLDVAGIVKTAQGGMGMRKAVMDRKAGRS